MILLFVTLACIWFSFDNLGEPTWARFFIITAAVLSCFFQVIVKVEYNKIYKSEISISYQFLNKI